MVRERPLSFGHLRVVSKEWDEEGEKSEEEELSEVDSDFISILNLSS